MSDKQQEKQDTLERYKDMIKEAEASLKQFMTDAKEAVLAYCGKLLPDNVKAELIEKGIPPIEVNLCEKPVHVVQGYYSQIMGEPGAFPVENADSYSASIISQAIKWNMLHKNIRDEILQAVKSAVISGIGFLELKMDYDTDIINGDISAQCLRYSQVLWDPLATSPTLSDAQYIIKRSFAQRRELADVYDDYAEEIMELKPIDKDDSDLINIELPHKRSDNDYVIVDEVWYKDYRKKAVVAYIETDIQGNQVVQKIEVNDYKRSDKKKIEATGGQILGVKLIPIIKRMVVINAELIVYDEVEPEYSEFPIIAFVYNYTPDAENWEDKIRGLVKTIKPHNDEINKRKSQMMAVTLQQPLSGHYVEESSLVSLEDFKMRSGPGKIIRYRGIKPEPIRGEFGALTALIQLDQMTRQDIYESGPNPDLLGGTGGSGPSAPGITVRTRQQTALTAMQAAFDNFNRSLKQVGRIMMALMLNNWDVEKFDKICDSEIPPDFDTIRQNAVYDIIIDEKSNDKLYQFGVFNSLLELAKLGLPISPELMLEYSGLDQKAKEMQMQYMMQMQQNMQQQVNNG